MGNDKANATLYASTGLPVSQITGEAIGQSPRRCSVNVVTPVAGKYDGKFHQRSVSGVTVAFQCRIAALSSGSPTSIGTAVNGVGRSRKSRTAVHRTRNAAVADDLASNHEGSSAAIGRPGRGPSFPISTVKALKLLSQKGLPFTHLIPGLA